MAEAATRPGSERVCPPSVAGAGVGSSYAGGRDVYGMVEAADVTGASVGSSHASGMGWGACPGTGGGRSTASLGAHRGQPLRHQRRLLFCRTPWCTMPTRLAALCALLLTGSMANADTAPDYDQLRAKKALAVAQGTSPVYGVAHSQPQNLIAAQLALADCEQRRDATNAPCELIQLNDQRITSAQELRDRLPASPRPLYLWRYASPGATVYLAGSIHILKPTLYPLPAPFEAAFEQSDALAVEVDLSAVTPAELQARMLGAGRLPEGQTLATVLPRRLYRRLARRLAGDGMDIAPLQGVKPALVMNQLTVFGLMAFGYSPQFGMEQYFTAKKGTRPILELESIDAQLELLFDQPLATQVQLLKDTLDQEAELEPLLAGMLRAWLSGADAEFLRLFEQQAGQSELARAFNRRLLDERNIGMARKVEEYLSGQGTYFVLVGAAHLVGAKGIVSLLAKQGLNGTRILSDAAL